MDAIQRRRLQNRLSYWRRQFRPRMNVLRMERNAHAGGLCSVGGGKVDHHKARLEAARVEIHAILKRLGRTS